jgi:hypothetical protein
MGLCALFAVAISACSGGNGGGPGLGTGGATGSGGSGNTGNAGNTGGGNTGGSAGVTSGKPTSLEAAAVGAYMQYGTSCTSGTEMSGFGAFLCPGGRIRGGGMISSVTELMCGSYTTAPAVYQNCNDKVGCFPKVNATVKDTLILGGQTDVDPSFEFTMLLVGGPSGNELMRPVQCNDGSNGYVYLERLAGDVGEDYCVSEACPAPGGSTGGGYGSCGTDCDCGTCWYCESGTCRYGGEGPYGCYAGCSG